MKEMTMEQQHEIRGGFVFALVATYMIGAGSGILVGSLVPKAS